MVHGADVNFINPDRLSSVIKLHGVLDQLDTLVVTEQDHTALLLDRRSASRFWMRSAMRSGAVVCFSLDTTWMIRTFAYCLDEEAESKGFHSFALRRLARLARVRPPYVAR